MQCPLIAFRGQRSESIGFVLVLSQCSRIELGDNRDDCGCRNECLSDGQRVVHLMLVMWVWESVTFVFIFYSVTLFTVVVAVNWKRERFNNDNTGIYGEVWSCILNL